ncbi:hypothetical protein BCR35DRAFT_276816 [Leucosporidium creatinivorum]|uniref:Glycosyl transferase CAP10 domain-containing protein n=1 Tax=Leucosporidium creatinivorum TaxID=106004 RepID=A0A1Y2FY59_9BASI|nr:hypothetical protein BCR35DRAFT_276816 [Leucosporidium creatinivorum]
MGSLFDTEQQSSSAARSPHRRRFLILLPCALLGLFVLALREHPISPHLFPLSSHNTPHPISTLIAQAAEQHRQRLTEKSTSLAEATELYRRRTGRLPPRGFDSWYHASRARGVCNLDRFDEMQKSLKMWWAVSPAEVRGRIDLLDRWGLGGKVAVRSGKVLEWKDMVSLGVSKGKDRASERNPFRLGWAEVLRGIEEDWRETLPDVDFIVNGLDEPRVLMDWSLRTELERLADLGQVRPMNNETPSFQAYRENGPSPFETIRRACPPSSLARLADVPKNLGSNPIISQEYTTSFTTPEGFIFDHAAERESWCSQPDLMQLHASYIHPINMHTSNGHGPWPIFSNSKLPGYSDILIPAWFYYDDHVHYDPSDDRSWEDKSSKLFWRGSNTGGVSQELNWIGWQRSRIVSLLNRPFHWHNLTTLLLSTPSSPPTSLSTTLPSSAVNEVLTDVAFSSVDQFGNPSSLEKQKNSPSFRFTGRQPFADNYGAKAVLDVDGTAFSGRFLTLMRSRSAVVKSRMYVEAWTEETLVPWFHYVPLSVRYSEVYSLLGYFFGVRDVLDKLVSLGEGLGWREMRKAEKAGSHEEELRMIAERGSQWARECGRKEDMESYAWLLALEWARLCSDERESMGFVL